MPQFSVHKLSDWLTSCLNQWPGGLRAERHAEYAQLTENLVSILGGGQSIWRQLPQTVHDIFGSRGWAWNGFYVRHGNQLDLAEGAVGPPVCATLFLQNRGDVGSSGSCWDAILMNQSIALNDVTQWPGYVSCDGESRLQTIAGIVCPVRGANHQPIAVWDLDTEAKLAPEDPVFMSRLLETLSVALQPSADDFA